jgi:hypothetical protein
LFVLFNLFFLIFFKEFTMKKLLTLICLVFLVSVASQAQYAGNGNQTAGADIGCLVITPLAIIQPQGTTNLDLTGQAVVAGFDRTLATAQTLYFPITGEIGKGITVTKTGPTCDKGGDVTLLGSGWSALPTAIGSDGTAMVTFNITGIHAGAGTHGTYTFTLKMECVYTVI